MNDFYQALLARDHRFDGKFFVAVKTTGIYCRPICPARPRRENIVFFPDAASAEAAGFRPCLRCRPECAPLSPAWWGKAAVVQRALKLISANDFGGHREEEFARRCGVSARHLRRLFEAEIGRTPKQIADANRLNFARRLIIETALPIRAVSRSAGFTSLRRFNDAFKKRFERAPSQLRKARSKSNAAGGIELRLAYRPPYDWQSLIDFYRTHSIPGAERIAENAFERVFCLDGKVGFLRVQPVTAKPQLKLTVMVDDPRLLFQVVHRVRRMFDLDSDPMLVAESFAQFPLLAELVHRFPGLRVPGGWDPFETAVCTILGQLVSAAQRVTLVHELVRAYGEAVVHPATGEKSYLFPRPEVLVRADLSCIRTSVARRETVREFSRQVMRGAISLSEAQDPAQFRKTLVEVDGLGAWTAEYISLRSIGDTDAFPRTDLILKRALALHPELAIDSVRPWRAYAAVYLWKEFARTLSKQKEAAAGHDSVGRALRKGAEYRSALVEAAARE